MNSTHSLASFNPAVLLLAACVLIFSTCAPRGNQVPVRAKDGALIISQPLGQDILKLNGEWAFHWGRFTPPDGHSAADEEKPAATMRVPGSWNGKNVNGKKIPAEGFATYRLMVKIPEAAGHHHAIEVGEIGTAYRLYVNGQLLGGKGIPGKVSAEGRPRVVSKIYIFTPAADEICIVLHVSNYHYRMGGIWGTIRLGNAETLLARDRELILFEAIFIGILMVTGLYHIIIASIHRREPASLFFGLACLVIAIRQCVIGHRLLLSVFPDTPWELYLRLEYLTIGFAVPFFGRYFYLIFTGNFSRKALAVFEALCGVFTAAVLLTPSRIYTETIIYYEGVVIALLCYSIYTAILSIRRGNRDVIHVLWPGILLSATAVNDILFANHIIFTMNLVPAGVFVFTFSQALLLARRYARTLSTTEMLTGELSIKNENLIVLNRQLTALKEGLEDKVAERTRDLETARDRAEAANRAKTVFLANVSHELRTPLNAILGFSELMEMKKDGMDPCDRESIRYIREAGDYLLSIVNDVLDMSKAEEGKITADMKDVDIAAFLRDFIPSMQSLAETGGLSFKSAVGDCHGTVQGDTTKLRQILTNLLANAIKFTPAGKEIGLEAVSNENSVTITVWDQGPGIRPDDIDRIFKPFEQVVTKEDGKPKGTGLGLSIARTLAELHSGTLTAQSEPGKGSRFTLTLPLVPGQYREQSAPASPEAPTDVRSGLAGRVLVVEDNDLIVRLMQSMLKMTSLEVTFATRGDEAVRLVVDEGRTFDIILMDIQLPGMDGATALGEIRGKLGGATPPAIALTAHAMSGDRDRFIAQGFTDYLAKPFRLEELQSKLQEHLG